jgi:hypothetical protein
LARLLQIHYSISALMQFHIGTCHAQFFRCTPQKRLDTLTK